MKPPKFHVGQAVVCITGDSINWLSKYNPGSNVALKDGAIYTVSEVWNLPGTDIWGVKLSERPLKNGHYSEKRFAPVELLPDEALAQLLEETLEPVTA